MSAAPAAAAVPVRPPPPGLVLAALLLVQVLFGLHYVVIKPAFAAGLDPYAWAAVRASVAAALLLGSARAWDCPLPRGRRDWVALAGLAVLGVVVNQVCFVVGLSYTTPGLSALINVTIPVSALAFAWLWRAERFDAARGAGVLAAGAGVALLLTGRLDADWKLGNWITLVNACSFGGFLVLSRPVYRRVHPYGGTAALFLCGAVMIVAAFGWRIPLVHWGALPLWAWGAMAYTVVGATVATYALNAFALRHADASVVGFFIFLQPLIAAGISAARGGEALGWRFAAASALVAVGVGVVLRRPGRARTTAVLAPGDAA